MILLLRGLLCHFGESEKKKVVTKVIRVKK